MEVNFNYLPWRGIWKIKKGAGLLKGRERGWSCWQFSYLIFSRFIIFRFIFLPPYFYEKSHSKLSRNLVFWIRARGGCLHERGGTVWSTLEGGGIERRKGSKNYKKGGQARSRLRYLKRWWLEPLKNYVSLWTFTPENESRSQAAYPTT